jgi:hypothetical protein
MRFLVRQAAVAYKRVSAQRLAGGRRQGVGEWHVDAIKQKIA